MTDRGPLGVFDEHVMPEARCPHCRHLFDRASAVRDHGNPPKPGDFTVCIGCAQPLRFETDLSLRSITREEFARLEPEALVDLARIVHAVRAVRRREAQERHRWN